MLIWIHFVSKIRLFAPITRGREMDGPVFYSNRKDAKFAKNHFIFFPLVIFSLSSSQRQRKIDLTLRLLRLEQSGR